MRSWRLCAGALGVLICVQAAPAQWTTVGDGFEYRSFTVAGPNNVFVARMDRANPRCILESSIGTGKLYSGRETVTNQAARYNDALNYWGEVWGQRNQVVVAINGDFFNLTTGVPTEGQILSGWYCNQFTEFGGWSGMAWTLDRNVFMGGCVNNPRAERIVHYLSTGATDDFFDINTERWRTNDLVIYSHHYDTNTHTDNNGSEVLVELDTPLLVKPNPGKVLGTVRQIRQRQGSTPIPFDHIVLSANGSKEPILLANVSVGARIGISQKIADYYPEGEYPGCATPTGNSWTRTYSVVGGNFTFLRHGVPQPTDNPGLVNRNPRTAVAYNDTYIFFIVDDGRSASSVGMSMTELADFCLQYLDATWGYNLDGGGSSTMVVNGVVKNVPSDGAERPVANGLMMVNVQPKVQSGYFSAGTAIKTIAQASLRYGPGTEYDALATIPANTQGTVLGHALRGIYAKGQYWWKCEFPAATGWVEQTVLAPVSGGVGPTITQHPANRVAVLGGNTSFSVQADGTPPLNYQWQKNQVNLTNGGPFSGVATPSLAITGVTWNEVASYRCAVSNAYGSATSIEAALTLRVPDFDADDDTDMTDFAHLQLCLGTANISLVPGCADADLSNDSAVNTTDVSKFKNCGSGQGIPYVLNCLTGP